MSQKSLACYNFDAHERILIFFGRNVTDKVDNQKTLYYATSNNLCFCTRGEWGKSGLRGNCSQLSNRVPASRIVVVIVSINRLVLIVGVEIRLVENFD